MVSTENERRVLGQLVDSLPETWTQDKRARWIHAMVCALDYVVTLDTTEPPSEAWRATESVTEGVQGD